MSGGHFDYRQGAIDCLADDIEDLILHNGDAGRHCYEPHTIDRFKEAVHHLRTAYAYARRIDWLVSGDDSEDSFHTRLAQDLSKIRSK